LADSKRGNSFWNLKGGFQMNDPSRVFISGPFAPFREGFLHSLLELGYTSESAANQLQLIAHLSRWLDGEGLDVQTFCRNDLRRYFQLRRQAGYTHSVSMKAMLPLLTYLKAEGVSLSMSTKVNCGPVEVAIDRYRDYLVQERGLSQLTIHSYTNAVRSFLQGELLCDGTKINWEVLNAAKVTAFVVARTPSQSRSMASATVTALRSFLGYLYANGLIKQELTAAVPKVARWQLAALPKTLQPREVRALLAACDRRTRMGRRDFAILTMLARLGLRASELAGLHLDDIDWRAGSILVRGKGNRIESLPCPQDVGEAVVAYLRRGRPTTAADRSLFVRIRAPHRALSGTGVSGIVAAAARRAGLGNIYAHLLRHTVASQLLRAGSSLPEIGQLLRHRHISTTAVYAKVDRDALRSIARPWLGGVA
jgi:integrase/recombinase XerD